MYNERNVTEVSAGAVIGLTDDLRISVLYVDEERLVSKVIKELLELQGKFQVDTACSVQDAYEKLKQRTYDAVISDYHMPEKDGLQFLKELRESGNGIPFILFTGKGREEIAAEALNLGADQYINKTGETETVYAELSHAILGAVKRRKTEEALQASEERFRAISEFAKDGIILIDDEGKIIYWNNADERIFGYTEKEVVGKDLDFLMTTDQARAFHEASRKMFAALRETGSSPSSGKTIEMPGVRKDGTAVPTELSMSALRIKNRWYGMAFVRDITDRKKSEEALRESEERFRTVFEGASEGILAADAESRRFVFGNAAMCELTGYSLKELFKLNVNDIHPKEDLPYVIDEFRKQVEGKTIVAANIPVLRKDSKVVYCDVSSKPLRFGKEEYLVGFFRDITERKQWEEALRDAKEKWTSLTENTDDIVMIVDGNGVIQYINRTIPPYTPEETVGRTVYDYVPREQHDVLEKSLREVFKTGKPDRYEVSSSIPTIGTIWFSTKIVPIKHDRKVSSAILISSDITERKKAEEKIRLLSNVVQQASEGIAVSDLNGRILFVNSAWLKMHRFNEDEEKDLVGKEVGRFYCRQQVESIDRKVQSAGIFRGRITQVRKDGTTFPALATLSPLKNENGQIIGIIRMAKNLTEIVRDIRDVGSSNVWSSKNGRTEGTGA